MTPLSSHNPSAGPSAGPLSPVERAAGLVASATAAAQRLGLVDLPHAGVTAPAVTLPTSAAEVWRYSRVDALDFSGLHLAVAVDAATALAQFTMPVPLGEIAASVVVVNGQVISIEVAPDAAALGLRVLSGRDLPEISPVVVDGGDAMVDLSVAITSDAVLIEVPPRVEIAGVVQVCNVITEDDVLVGTRIIVRAGTQSAVAVVERVFGSDVRSVLLPVIEVDVDDAASVRFLSVQELGPKSTQIAHQQMSTGRDASLRAMSVALGGSYARVRTDAVMTGTGGFNELLAVYFGEKSQMHDFRTMQHHVAANTTSELLFKGAVEDQAQSVYSGLIRIGKDARRTVANQANRNLVLSPGATAESVPNLEIENNDVKCSHASAVGPVDDDHRYYLELRGVPTDEAERLIVLGFFADVLDRSPIPGLTPQLSGAIAEKFERRNS